MTRYQWIAGDWIKVIRKFFSGFLNQLNAIFFDELILFSCSKNRVTGVKRSFHSSESIVSLEWLGRFTPVKWFVYQVVCMNFRGCSGWKFKKIEADNRFLTWVINSFICRHSFYTSKRLWLSLYGVIDKIDIVFGLIIYNKVYVCVMFLYHWQEIML